MVPTQYGSVLHLCTKFQADSIFRSKVIRGSQHLEIRSRDPGHAQLGVVLSFMMRSQGGSVLYVCTKFQADTSFRSKVISGPNISKLGHVTQATPT